MKIIIAGGRDFKDYKLLESKCDEIIGVWLSEVKETVTIISGTASGADKLGEQYAKENAYGLERFPADWVKWGRSAGPRRNAEMAENADALIAFWDGKSAGTANMIQTAKARGLHVEVVNY